MQMLFYGVFYILPEIMLIPMISANFDMHTLKQVYLYVISVALYGLNQVQNFVWI